MGGIKHPRRTENTETKAGRSTSEIPYQCEKFGVNAIYVSVFVTPHLAHLAPKLTAVNQSVKRGGGCFSKLQSIKIKE